MNSKNDYFSCRMGDGGRLLIIFLAIELDFLFIKFPAISFKKWYNRPIKATEERR